eukprot:4713312-Prymnesium_polylepis.1
MQLRRARTALLRAALRLLLRREARLKRIQRDLLPPHRRLLRHQRLLEQLRIRVRVARRAAPHRPRDAGRRVAELV